MGENPDRPVVCRHLFCDWTWIMLGSFVGLQDVLYPMVAAIGSLISGSMIWILSRALKGQHRPIILRCRPAVTRRDPDIPQWGNSFADTSDTVVGTVAAIGSLISGSMIWILLRALKGQHRQIILRCRPAVIRRDPDIPQWGNSFADTSDTVVRTVAATGSLISGSMIWILLRALKGQHRQIILRCHPEITRRDPGIPQWGNSFADTSDTVVGTVAAIGSLISGSMIWILLRALKGQQPENIMPPAPYGSEA